MYHHPSPKIISINHSIPTTITIHHPRVPRFLIHDRIRIETYNTYRKYKVCLYKKGHNTPIDRFNRRTTTTAALSTVAS